MNKIDNWRLRLKTENKTEIRLKKNGNMNEDKTQDKIERELEYDWRANKNEEIRKYDWENEE